MKNNAGAIEDYNKALQIDSTYINAYINRANSKSELKDYDGAIDDCNKVLEIDPEFAIAYFTIGYIQLSYLKEFKAALNYFSKAIELSKENPDPNFIVYSAEAKYALGNFNGAIEDCNLAIQIAPNYLYSYIARAKAKLMLGQKESACADFSKAVSLGYIDETGMIKNNCK